MDPKVLVSDRLREPGWLNSEEGHEWLRARTELFSRTAAAHEASQKKK